MTDTTNTLPPMPLNPKGYGGHLKWTKKEATKDADKPSAICDRNGEVVLAQCRVCGRGEVELSEPCATSQQPLTREQQTQLSTTNADSLTTNTGATSQQEPVARVMFTNRRMKPDVEWLTNEVRDGTLLYNAPPVQKAEAVAYWIPKAEQFCIADKSGRPFARAWEPLYAAPQPERAGVVPKDIAGRLQSIAADLHGREPDTIDAIFEVIDAINAAPPVQPGPMGREGCNYMCMPGKVCRKCGHVHDIPLTGPASQQAEPLALTDRECWEQGLPDSIDRAMVFEAQAVKDAGRPSKLDRECLRLGQEIQRAAGELPPGWNIEIDVERGAGSVTLIDPEGDPTYFTDMSEGMSHALTDAIAAAKKDTP